jgi:ribonucleoside-diphosphate reductase alpha chain
LNHESLAVRGFTKNAIEKVEAYLSETNDVRTAITPWIVGVDFCRDSLKVPADKVEDFEFDLLSFLGFSTAEVVAANHYVFGYGTLEASPDLRHEHRAIFACGDEVGSMARVKMAAAVQSFVTGDVDLSVSLAASSKAEARSEILIEAWKQGLKQVNLYFDFEGKAEAILPAKAVSKPARRDLGKPAPQSAMPKAKAIAAAPAKRSVPKRSTVASPRNGKGAGKGVRG